MERIFEPCGFTTYEITTFENINVGAHDPSRSHDLRNVHWPLSRNRKRKSETEQMFELCGFNTYEITTFENIDFRSHDPSRSHDLANVNWKLSC